MDFGNKLSVSRNDDDICLADSATTHTILRNKKYFSNLTLVKAKVNTITGSTDAIEGSGRATIILKNGTKLRIHDALYSSKSRRNLLSFKDIRNNGYHIETMSENNTEFLCITCSASGQRRVLEKLPTLKSGLYYTKIKAIETYAVMNQKFHDPKTFML